MTENINTQHKDNREILKSTGLLGGSSLMTILIGMARTKIIAILLGPAGVGYIGTLTSLRDVVLTISNLGLSSSGMRQIASASAKTDYDSVSITIKTIKILAWITGILGMFVMVGFSGLFSLISFKSTQFAIPIAFLGISVLFSSISIAQTTILQGHRRILEVAKVNIIGAITGTLAGLPLYFFLGNDGIVPSIVLASFLMFLTSWWFTKKIALRNLAINKSQIFKEARNLLRFGLPLMFSVLIGFLTTYVIQVYLTRNAGVASVGLYQAAFSLSGVLVSFVLTAMGTDYYPRLVAVAENNTELNREVNSQTTIGLLLAVPALAATVVFMPIIIRIFYTAKFDLALPILRWAVFGVLGRIIAWPLSYVMLAKGKSKLFFITEVICGIFQVSFMIICYTYFGLQGTGISFMFLYLFYIVLLIIISNVIAKVKWSFRNFILIILSIFIVLVLSIIPFFEISRLLVMGIQIFCLLFVCFIYFRKLLKISAISINDIINKFWKK